MSTVRLSTKGQIIIPKEIRQEYHWHKGMEFNIKGTASGIVLKPIPPVFPETDIDDVFGCMAYQGKVITLEEMEKAIAKGAREHK